MGEKRANGTHRNYEEGHFGPCCRGMYKLRKVALGRKYSPMEIYCEININQKVGMEGSLGRKRGGGVLR